jgi:hypothetical protein
VGGKREETPDIPHAGAAAGVGVGKGGIRGSIYGRISGLGCKRVMSPLVPITLNSKD